MSCVVVEKLPHAICKNYLVPCSSVIGLEFNKGVRWPACDQVLVSHRSPPPITYELVEAQVWHSSNSYD